MELIASQHASGAAKQAKQISQVWRIALPALFLHKFNCTAPKLFDFNLLGFEAAGIGFAFVSLVSFNGESVRCA